MFNYTKLSAKVNYFLVSILVFLVSCNTISDEQSVLNCFENYKEAVHYGETERAAAYVHQNTFDYWSQILDHVRKTDSIQLNKLPVNDQLLTMVIRNNFTKEEIATFNGRSLFTTFIRPEYMDTESIIDQKLGAVIVDGSEAFGKIILNGEETPWGYQFHQTQDGWKIDVSSLNFLAEKVANDIIMERGITRNQYVIESIEIKTGATMNKHVWNPL